MQIPENIKSALVAIVDFFRIEERPFFIPVGRLMSLRHKLIEKLAMGDAILMNFERRCTGNIVPLNLRPLVFRNVRIEQTIYERHGIRVSGLDPFKTSAFAFGHGMSAAFERVHINGLGISFEGRVKGESLVDENFRLEEENDKLRRELADLREMAWHFGPYCSAANAEILNSAADELDCGSDCENGWQEWDTGAFVCSKEEHGTCGWSKAESLREISKSFERFAARPSL